MSSPKSVFHAYIEIQFNFSGQRRVPLLVIDIYRPDHSPVNVEMHLLDLPDELLLFVFSQCTAVDALFTFTDLHPRLDRIVRDPMLVRHLNFTLNSANGQISSMLDHVVTRLCDTILPRISDRIERLILDPSAMERVLTPSIQYPNLSSLTLLNLPRKSIAQHLTGKVTVAKNMNENVSL